MHFLFLMATGKWEHRGAEASSGPVALTFARRRSAQDVIQTYLFNSLPLFFTISRLSGVSLLQIHTCLLIRPPDKKQLRIIISLCYIFSFVSIFYLYPYLQIYDSLICIIFQSLSLSSMIQTFFQVPREP